MSRPASSLPSRRGLLGLGLSGAGVLALAACGVPWSDVRVDTGRTPTPPTPDGDDLARFAAVEAISTALATARAAGPGDGTAAAAVTLHEEHLRQLGPLPGPVPSGSPTPPGWPTTTPTTGAGTAEAEQVAARTLLTGVEEREPGLGTLLTSIATSCLGLAGGAASAPVPDVRGRLSGTTAEDVVAAAGALIEADRYASHAYATVAAALQEEERDRAVRALRVHGDRALSTQALVEDGGFTVAAAPAGYAVPPVAGPETARRAAADLEAGCARAAAALIRSGVRPLNLLGVRTLVDAGTRQASWGRLVAFPGIPDLS